MDLVRQADQDYFDAVEKGTNYYRKNRPWANSYYDRSTTEDLLELQAATEERVRNEAQADVEAIRRSQRKNGSGSGLGPMFDKSPAGPPPPAGTPPPVGNDNPTVPKIQVGIGDLTKK